MNYYHFTTVENFAKILESECLLSYYKIVKHFLIENGMPIHKAEAKTERHKKIIKQTEGKEEHFRLSNVFLTLNERKNLSSQDQLYLKFSLLNKPNYGPNLALSKLSLEDLTAIGVLAEHISEVENLLKKTLGQKYAHILVYQIRG